MLHLLTRGAQITGVAAMALCLTWISVSLRFYVRIRILKFVGREDWLTVAAMICMTTLCYILLRTEYYGLGAHMHSIPSDDFMVASKLIFVGELLYVATTTTTKLSIGVYFLRLSSKFYQIRIIYTALTIVMLFSTMYFFFLLFQCRPINHLWIQYSVGGSTGVCLGKRTLANVTYAHAAMSAVTDWAFGLLPIAFVWKMQMNPRTKVSVIFILSLGFFASSATIVRIVYIRQLEFTTDYSWYGINLVKWSMVEPAIAITAAAIATLRPMFKNFFFFARKRFYEDIDDDDSLGRESQQALENSDYNAFSDEFAEMLGLSRVGVTTHISAGDGSDAQRNQIRNRMLAKVGGKLPRRLPSQHDNERQTELRAREEEEKGLDWSSGITKTTVISYE